MGCSHSKNIKVAKITQQYQSGRNIKVIHAGSINKIGFTSEAAPLFASGRGRGGGREGEGEGLGFYIIDNPLGTREALPNLISMGYSPNVVLYLPFQVKRRI